MPATDERLLVFELHGLRYGLPLETVTEVLEPQTAFPIPRGPGFFLGAINYHGRIVAIISLATLLNLRTGSDGRGRIIVLDPAIANLALEVGQSVDIVPADEVLEEEAGREPFQEKILYLADGEVTCLNLEELLLQVEGCLTA